MSVGFKCFFDRKYCSKSCYHKSRVGKRSSNWKGGRKINNGYVLLHKPEHPSSDPHGYVYEHRVVMEEYLGRYPSGFKKEIIKKRIERKKHILDLLDSSQDDWNDWKWQFRHVFKDESDVEIIKEIIELEPDEEEAIILAIEHKVPFGITPHYLHLMDTKASNLDYAIRRQVIPPLSYVKNMADHNADKASKFDFMREHDTSPIDLVTRRYPKVAIIKPYNSCPQICVYCQRNWEITSPFMKGAMASKKQIKDSIEWFSKHDQIMDVLYGGAVYVLGAAATITSVGAITALRDEKHLEAIYNKMDKRRKTAYRVLKEIPGVSMTLPESGILAWLDISRLGTSEEVVAYILKHARILVNDGIFYGEQGKGFIRIVVGCFDDDETAENAFVRIRDALSQLSEEKGISHI